MSKKFEKLISRIFFSDIYKVLDLPKGLQIIEDFITENEEQDLLKSFNWQNDQILKNRQVRHYGKEFVYGSNMIADENDAKIEPFPESWTPLIQKSLDQGFQKRWPDQCTVNRYLPGKLFSVSFFSFFFLFQFFFSNFF